MKTLKNSFVLTAIAVLGIVSCNEASLTPDLVPEEGKLVTVHFGTENTDPSTKATLTPDAGETAFQAAWENEDEIAIQYTYVESDITATAPGTWDSSASKFSATLTDLTTGDEVLKMKYQASYPYSKDGFVDFGSVRTQTGAAYNSIYDLMVAEPVTVTAKPGLDESGNAIVFPMQRQTAIAYFHFTSNINEAITKATLKVEGEGAAIAAETVILQPSGMVYETGLSEIVLTISGQTADDFTLWFNVLPTTFTKMTLTVETATKTFTISNTKGGSYTAGKLYKVKKENIAWTNKPTTIYFYESFNQTTGTGGNDGEWKGSIASSNVTYDNTGWVVSNEGGANQCLKLGTGSKKGSATTPALGIESQSASLYFKAGAWNSADERTTINLSVSGSGTISPALVSLDKGAWSEYECSITGADASTKIVFSAVNASDNRFFIDEVYVYSGPKPAGITLYTVSMAPVEGGTLSASHSEANAGAVVTLTATPNEGFEFKSWEVVDSKGTVIEVDGNTFTMPAANVTVSASFSKSDYSITKTTSERGSIVVKKGDVEVATAQMGDEITLTATPNEGFEFKSWEVVDSKGTDIKVVDNKFTMPASAVTITATFISTASYTVSFSVNGNVTNRSYKESEKIEFPADPEISGVTFMGWITNTIEGTQAEAPVFVETSSAVMGTENLTYYAVFATETNGGTSWVKKSLSQIDGEGVYALLTTDGHAFSGTINSSGHGEVTSSPFVFTDNVATSAPEGVCEITFISDGSGYKMYNASKGYLYAKASGSGNLAWQSSETSYWLNKSSNWTYANNSAYLRSYNNSSLRTYSANNGAVLSFAKKTINIVLSDYCTNVVTLTSVAVSGDPTKMEYTVNEAFDPTGLTVTGTYSNRESAEITDGISWECSPTTFAASGNQPVSVTATVKSIKSAAYVVNVTVNTITNTLKATDKSINVNSNLDVSSLFTTNSDATIDYTLVENPSNAGTLSGSSFSATAAGTYKVKASQAATTKYSAAEATAIITVKVTTTVTLGTDWNTLFGTSYTGTFSTSANNLSLSGTNDGVTISVVNGNSKNGYVKTSDFRAYTGYTITLSVPDGKKITAISTTKGGKTFTSGISANAGNGSIKNNAYTWSGSSQEVILSISDTVSFATIVVTYE